jgi:hypothetical protein
MLRFLDITDVLYQQWPIATIFVIVIVGVIVVTWRVSRFVQRLDKVEDKIKDSHCVTHLKSTSDLNTLMHKVSIIEKAIIAMSPEKLDIFSEAHSPRQLNDLGEKLYKQSSAQQVLEENTEYLITQINKLRPETAYDVEECAYKALIDGTSQDWFNPIKVFLYNNPVFEEHDINLAVICHIMSIELRNKYLSIHPELQ